MSWTAKIIPLNQRIRHYNFKREIKISLGNVGIIGTGNLGQSLAHMILNRNYESLICGIRRKEREKELRQNLKGNNIKFTMKNTELAKEANCIFLSVKPGQIRDVCNEISDVVNPETSIISVAAAVPLVKLREWLPHSQIIIRCMPNIPCSIGQGVIPYISHGNSEKIVELVEKIFKPNLIVPLQTDEQIDASTLISGCGPAFLSWYIDCLKPIAENNIQTDDLNEMIIQTMIGTANLLRHSSCSNIIKNVASPKGATEAALHSFESHKINNIIYDSLSTAQKRIISIIQNL